MTGSRAGWKPAALLSLLAVLAAVPVAARRPPAPTWSRIGPVGAWVNAMAVTASGRALAATADAGLFRSDDGGLSWTPSGAGLPNAEVLDVAADPSAPAVAYAATHDGLFRSRDGGATWAATSLHAEVDRLAIAPSLPRRLYAVTGLATGAGRPWRSDDGGATWRAIGSGISGGASLQGLAVDPAEPGRAYLALDGRHLFTTGDAGAHWSDESAVLPTRSVDVFAADRAGALYLGSDGAFLAGGPDLFRSRDGGATWTALSPPPHPSPIRLLAAAPDGAVYAGFGSGGAESALLVRSADGGASWAVETVREGLRQMAFDPRRPERAFAGSRTRVLRRDAGGAWAVASGNLRAVGVGSVRADPHVPGTLYVSTLIGAAKVESIGFGLFRSRDGGATWERADRGLPIRFTSALVTSPWLPAGSLFALAGGIYESVDGGGDWSPLADPGYGVVDVEVAPGRPQTLLAAANSSPVCGLVGGLVTCSQPPLPRVVLSVDGGATWSDLSGRLSPEPYFGTFSAVRIDPAHPWLAYLVGTVSYRSRDGGATWTAMPLSIEAEDLLLDPVFPRTLYASDSLHGGVWKSVDAGGTWVSASRGLPIVNRFVGGELAADAATATVYVATDFGVFASRDRAATWQLLPGIPNPEVESVAVDPFRPGVVYAGTAGGLFVYSP